LRKNKRAVTRKKTGLYIAAGIAVAVIVIAAIFASGVPFPGFGGSQKNAGTGTLSVAIMDAPANLTHLNVTVSALFIQNSNNDSWLQLNFTDGVPQVYFDLLALKNITQDLSTSAIPVGNYTKLRLDVSSANATLNDGSTEQLVVPPGHIDVIVSIEIKEGQTTNVILDMQVDTTAISHSGNLKPVLKATVQYL